MDRRRTTTALTHAAMCYLLKKGFACYKEIGLVKWGRRRADVLALNLRGEIVIVEVKACPADYLTDKKWHMYLEHCNQMFFCLTEDTYAQIKEHAVPVFKQHGVGVLLLSPKTGYLYSALGSKKRKMSGINKKSVVVRMAWRNADMSKRTNRRVRIFLDATS